MAHASPSSSLTATLTVAAKPSRADRLAPVYAGQGPLFAGVPGLDKKTAATATRLAQARKFAAGCGETLVLPTEQGQWVFLGLGAPERLTRPEFAGALAAGGAELRKAGAHEASVLLPDPLPAALPTAREAAREAAQALLMAGYAFRPYKTRGDAPPRARLELVHADVAGARAGLRAGQTVGEAVALTRDLVNHPAAVAHPAWLLEQAHAVARAAGATCKDIVGEALLRQGYGAIYAVGQASDYPPALAVLEYGRPGPQRPTVALVGKGVTFDTGGLDLKGASNMALMKKDMGGAATVLGAFQAIAALRLPVHLVAVLGIVENAVGSRSYRPGDVVRPKAGPSIEITNTDAEGRVVLADALGLARTYKPDYLIDLATLTGACRTALGRDLMGLFCDHEPLRTAIAAAAAATGDHVWPLPLWRPYRRKLDSPVADLVNSPSDSMGGAITAALFLKEYAGEVAWAHLDCYAWSEGDQPLFPKGGSGAGVRLLVDLIPRLTGQPADET
jgi:leucyl aminopeptidase